MGKSLRYWRRDTRYLAALGLYPVMIVFFVAMGFMLPETRPMMLGMTIFMCGMSGMSLANEIGFDGPAGWVNIVTGLPSRANLLGRIAAMALLMVPGVVLVTVTIPLLYGMPQLLPMTVLGLAGDDGLRLGDLDGGGGDAPLTPSSAPGTNPMKDKSASSSNAMIAMTVAMLAVFVPLLPALGVGIWGAVVGSMALTVLAGVLALVAGAVVFLDGPADRGGADRCALSGPVPAGPRPRLVQGALHHQRVDPSAADAVVPAPTVDLPVARGGVERPGPGVVLPHLEQHPPGPCRTGLLLAPAQQRAADAGTLTARADGVQVGEVAGEHDPGVAEQRTVGLRPLRGQDVAAVGVLGEGGRAISAASWNTFQDSSGNSSSSAKAISSTSSIVTGRSAQSVSVPGDSAVPGV